MASVWVSLGDTRADRKLVWNMSMEGAQQALSIIGLQFIGAVPKRTVKHISPLEIHGYEAGKVIAHFYVEPLSPPSKPSGGDMYRNNTAKGA